MESRNKILHITNDYAGSTVYKNLVAALDNLGIEQLVYTPIKEEAKKDINAVNLKVTSSKIIYSHILNKSFDRIFYKRKTRKILKDIEKKIDLSTIRFIHAHTWYSDGGVAFLLHKKYNIPYIVTIRTTDLNLFQKYMVHLRPFGRKILSCAKNVILISASYKSRIIEESSLQSIKAELADKIRIIPNGVDGFWIKAARGKRVENNNKIFHCLFIGKFTYGKNILPLQLAVSEINREGAKIHLHIIGGGGKAHQKVMEQIQLYPETMTYYGKVTQMDKLKEHFEKADIFAMPSRHETFGLVYIEALLQGMPVLYTHNEGIDGFYEEKIGEKVTSSNVSEIKSKLLALIDNYDTYSIPTEKLKLNHDWEKIALIYQTLYQN